jgi:hypothetical protein
MHHPVTLSSLNDPVLRMRALRSLGHPERFRLRMQCRRVHVVVTRSMLAIAAVSPYMHLTIEERVQTSPRTFLVFCQDHR